MKPLLGWGAPAPRKKQQSVTETGVRKTLTTGETITATEAERDPRNVHVLSRSALYRRLQIGVRAPEELWREQTRGCGVEVCRARARVFTLSTGEQFTDRQAARDHRNRHGITAGALRLRLVKGDITPEMLWRKPHTHIAKRRKRKTND